MISLKGEIQTEIIDTYASRCQYQHRIQLWVCKDQQDGFMHSFMHFAPQLAGDKETEDASCKIP